MIVHILGVPMDLGSGRRGVDMGPSAIRIAGLADRLRELGHKVVDDGDVSIKNMEELKVGDPRARYLGEIARASGVIKKRSSASWAGANFRNPRRRSFDRGGNLSGVAAAARKEGKKVGVLWVDAHGDINTPETSPSGNIHGMPIAALLRARTPRVDANRGVWPQGGPANVVLVGIRSLDEGEKRLLKKTGVQVHTMSDIDRHGIHRIMKKALARLTDGTDLCM